MTKSDKYSSSRRQTSISKARPGSRFGSSLGSNMQALVSRTKAFLTPVASSTSIHKQSGIQTAKSPSELFPTVDPKIDGEDCLRDCESCTISLPRKWEIDEEDKLYGHVKGWDTHLIVATGKTDWVRDIADEKGSLMEKIEQHGLTVKNGKVMLSASDMPTGEDHEVDRKGQTTYADNGRTRCLVLPKWRMVEGVGRGEVDWLMDEVIGAGPTNLSPIKWNEAVLEKVSLPDEKAKQSVDENGHKKDLVTENEGADDGEAEMSGLTMSPSKSQTQPHIDNVTPSTNDIPSKSIPQHVTVKPCPHRAVILMCSHQTRDWRCGASAPLLRREFERHLRPLGLYRDLHDERPGGVGIYFINHVGGHKYSSNVMIYRREPSKGRRSTLQANNKTDQAEEELSEEAVQGIWLARVRPEDCENIVKYTVLQGKLVKPQRQLRGGFDRNGGKVSW